MRPTSRRCGHNCSCVRASGPLPPPTPLPPHTHLLFPRPTSRYSTCVAPWASLIASCLRAPYIHVSP
jgi:hypothetical protein